MFRCENQFSEKIRSIEWRHDKPFDIDRINIDDLIWSYDQGRRELHQKMNQLKEVKASRSLFDNLQ